MPVLRPLASALDYAHKQGMIHRDINPSNIILQQMGESLRVILLDFGLVRGSENVEIITVEPMIGTPEYMAPEQITLDRQIGPSADLYALGVIAFQMLTGQVPFRLPRQHPKQFATILHAHVYDDVPSPRELNEHVTPEVADILVKMLAKSPDDRYPTALTFVDALETAVQAKTQDNRPAVIALDKPRITTQANLEFPEKQERDEVSDELILMRLDTALPEMVVVEQIFELAVMIRQLSSEVINEPDLKRIKSGEIQINWMSNQTSIRLKIRINAPECEIIDTDLISFRLRRDQDSPVFYFLLKPKRVGVVTIVVSVFQEIDWPEEIDWLGSARLKAVALTSSVGEVTTSVNCQALNENPLFQLSTNLLDHFSLDELRQLCFILSISHEDFTPKISTFTRELVEYCNRHDRINELILVCEKQRPDVYWQLEEATVGK